MVGERNASFRFKGRRVLLVKKDAVAPVEKLFELRGDTSIDPREIFFEIFDVGLKIGLVFVRANQAEGVLPGRKNVEPAIFILLQDFHDYRGAADSREIAFMEKDDAEWGFCFQALARHQRGTGVQRCAEALLVRGRERR